MTKIEFYQYFLAKTQWLYFKIYQNEWFFFDLWSVVHFGSGVVFYLLINSLFKKYVTQIFVGILVFYELFEIFLLYFLVHVILPETFKDQFTDILIGLIGGFFGKQYLSLSRSLKPFVRLFFISCVFGYLFVGFKYFLPDLVHYKTLNPEVGVILKVFFFSFIIIGFSDFLFSKIKKKGLIILSLGGMIVVLSYVIFYLLSLPQFSFFSIIVYASGIISANRCILFLVNLWKKTEKYFREFSTSNYYSELFHHFQKWQIK